MSRVAQCRGTQLVALSRTYRCNRRSEDPRHRHGRRGLHTLTAITGADSASAYSSERVLSCRVTCSRSLQAVEGTFAGLRFVRNQMGYHVDPASFIEPLPGPGGTGTGPVAGWIWKPVPAPPTGQVSSRGSAWVASRLVTASSPAYGSGKSAAMCFWLGRLFAGNWTDGSDVEGVRRRKKQDGAMKVMLKPGGPASHALQPPTGPGSRVLQVGGSARVNTAVTRKPAGPDATLT